MRDELAGKASRDLLRDTAVGLRVDAGNPSLKEVEKAAAALCVEEENAGWVRLPDSTLSDYLSGRRDVLPDWRFIHTFVVVCHRLAIANGLEPEPLRDLKATFGALWKAAKHKEKGSLTVITPLPYRQYDILEPTI
ncbi:hypothetical protein [Herbidospora mongoliensis]|uniref:hypothetical protein n=1 Tax=Herbidospora mongoliensis TaxID=688067 RepID=UPI000835FC2A|nr:hypothetical protein [Herbidospora mongoliensis]